MIKNSFLRNHNAADIDHGALRLVEFFGANPSEPKWMTEKEKLEARAKGIHYIVMSVLHFIAMLRAQILFTMFTNLATAYAYKYTKGVELQNPHAFLGHSKKQYFPYPSPNSTIVPGTFLHLSTSESKAKLEHFTSYQTQYYDSDAGKDSSYWLYAKILTYTAELASDYQRKLINIEPRGLWALGSGTVTILEAYRAILLGNYIPVSPLEFHFYSGEEVGLLGSQAIVSRYETAGTIIKAMIQFDMTARIFFQHLEYLE
ncbi:hypothetical protein C8R44DRAFT_884767 [Mycena epipterygia]|nr:hypothetical protein C8R44DRAFT_884767 [Mycena epipterygia]